jgi:5,10-methylenetetrahydromethanopterin reductase
MFAERKIGVCVLSVTPLKNILHLAQVAEEAGIDSFWLSEGYHFFRDLGEPKSTTSIAAAIAARTKRIKIGLGIVPPYTRHPALLAMEAHTLSRLSEGRFILGVGAAKAAALHIGYEEKTLRAVTTHRECIDLVRKVLSGDAFEFSGKIYSMNVPARDASIIPPVVPVILGATGPKMLQLGGEVADAVLLPTFTTPRFVEYAMEQIEKGAKRAGRSINDIPVGATLPFSVAEDGDAARDAIRKLTAVYIANKIQNIRNDVILSSAGLTESEALPISEAMTRRGADAAAGMVTDEILDKVVVAGTPEEVTRKLLDLAAAGLRLPLMYQLLGPDKEAAIRLVAAKVKPNFEAR